jgi:hypothetical protein
VSLPITRRGHWPSADQCFPASPAHQGDRVVLERALQPHLQTATGRPTECRQRCQRIEPAPLFGQLRRGQACVPGSGSRRGGQRIRSIATLSNVRFRELRQALRTARMGAKQPARPPSTLRQQRWRNTVRHAGGVAPRAECAADYPTLARQPATPTSGRRRKSLYPVSYPRLLSGAPRTPRSRTPRAFLKTRCHKRVLPSSAQTAGGKGPFLR